VSINSFFFIAILCMTCLINSVFGETRSSSIYYEYSNTPDSESADHVVDLSIGISKKYKLNLSYGISVASGFDSTDNYSYGVNYLDDSYFSTSITFTRTQEDSNVYSKSISGYLSKSYSLFSNSYLFTSPSLSWNATSYWQTKSDNINDLKESQNTTFKEYSIGLNLSQDITEWLSLSLSWTKYFFGNDLEEMESNFYNNEETDYSLLPFSDMESWMYNFSDSNFSIGMGISPADWIYLDYSYFASTALLEETKSNTHNIGVTFYIGEFISLGLSTSSSNTDGGDATNQYAASLDIIF
jgi:hypothetical protein